jgi:hypothetical protein
VGVVCSKVGMSSFYLLERVALVIEFDEIQGMDLIGIFPGVVALRVALPFDEVLQGSKTSLVLVATYLIHFIFLFPSNQIWGWLGEVWAM